MEIDNKNFAKGMDKQGLMEEMTYVDIYSKDVQPSLQVYHSIKKYCSIYNVPEVYAFKVAYIESGWRDPFQATYNPYNKVSTANALGVMQVLRSTARDVWQDDSITSEQLLNDIDYNVHTAIKYMSQLYEDQHDWARVYAIYNTGYVRLNDYALSVVNHGK
jgi:soluble lytic murein transglycosylase-like protein